MLINKWLATLILSLLISIVFIIADRLFGRAERARMEEIELKAEVGDLIFRANSYILSSGKYYFKSGLPGHIAIVVSEGVFTGRDGNMGNISVIESALLNRSKGEFQAVVATNKMNENFGHPHGKRFLLKMHLNDEQKKKLIKLTGEQTGKPYSIFASSNSQVSFNCATFVRWAMLEVTGFDLDSDKGFIVFPNDILHSPRFDRPGDRVRF